MVILVWALSGSFFNYSDTWQLVINTGTTIITFLMVFLIQKTQNKDSIVIQIKLNELVAAEALASNRIISVEDLTEEELLILNQYYTQLAKMTQKETNLRTSHSIEEARQMHDFKQRKHRRNDAMGQPQQRRKRKPRSNNKPKEDPAA